VELLTTIPLRNLFAS